MDLEAETLTFVRKPEPTDCEGTGVEIDIGSRRPVSIDDIFTPHDFGPWPEGFRCSREELYGDDGR